MSRRKKSFQKMRPAEIEAATAEFDREFVVDTFGEPPPRTRARWLRARRRPGRPRKGRGAKIISVSVERTLLARADALAQRLGATRAEIIARGFKAVLAAQGEI